MASAAPVLLSDGTVQLQPAAPALKSGMEWQAWRLPTSEQLGSICLYPLTEGPVATPDRLRLAVTMNDDAATADVLAMAQAVRLACRWAFTSLAVGAVEWLGPTSPTLRAVVHHAGFRIHPLAHRAAWLGPGGPADAWYGDLTAADAFEPDSVSLTAREQHVLAQMARGRSNAQIAEQLAISENTVKNHVRSILDQLQATSRTSAVIIALQTGLVSLEGSS